MSAPILLSTDPKRVSLAPGANAELSVHVQNLTSLVDQIALRVEGVAPTWVQLIPPYLPVFAQGNASARVVIAPPGDPAQSGAGVYGLHVVGLSQENGAEGTVDAVLEVQLAGDYQLRLERAQAISLQEARYAVRVLNGANASLQLRLAGSDKADALWYKFEPFQLNVPAGRDATATLAVRVKQVADAQRAIAFSVGASGNYLLQGGAQVAAHAHQVAAQFVQAAPAVLGLAVTPAQLSAEAGGDFDVRVSNPGAEPLSVRLEASSDDGALILRVEPAELTLQKQGEAHARLSVMSRALATAEPSSKTIRLRASPVDGVSQPVSAEVQFVQVKAPQAFPWWLVVAGLIVLMLIGITLLLIVSANMAH